MSRPMSLPHLLCILSSLGGFRIHTTTLQGSPHDVECYNFLCPDVLVGGQFLSLPSFDIHRVPQAKVSLDQLWYDPRSVRSCHLILVGSTELCPRYPRESYCQRILDCCRLTWRLPLRDALQGL